MQRIRSLVLVMITVLFVCAGQGSVRAGQHTHYRYANTFVTPVNKDWSVYLYQEFNIDGDHQHDLIGHCNEVGATYSGFASWFDATVALSKYYGKSSGDWQGELSPFVAGKVKWSFVGFNMSNTSRFDHNHRDKADDRLVYRDIFSVATQKTWTRLEAQPFVANEAIYDFDAEILGTNQLKTGVNFRIMKDLSGSVFYMWDMSHTNVPDNDHWRTTPMVGFTTTVNF